MINAAMISEIAGVIKSIAEVGTAVIAVTDAVGLTDINKTAKPVIDTKTYSGTNTNINDVVKSVSNLCDVVSNVSSKNENRAFKYVGSIQSK